MQTNARTIGTQAYPALMFPSLKKIYPAPINVKTVNNMLKINAIFFIVTSANLYHFYEMVMLLNFPIMQ